MKQGWVEYGKYSAHYVDGCLHNDTGPAVITDHGTKRWYKYNLSHREDGPAIEWYDGDHEWWYNGVRIKVSSNKEFMSWFKFKAFI